MEAKKARGTTELGVQAWVEGVTVAGHVWKEWGSTCGYLSYSSSI